MASKPLDTYIKTPPPSNPASKETYLEQQLISIEKVLQKHSNTIEENYADNVASITTEQGVRATADSALAYSIEQLTASVDVNNTQTQAQITNLQTAAADASTATATQLQTLSAKVDTNLGSTNAAIANEQKVRATADSSLASRISSLAAQTTFNNTQVNTSINTEQTVRASANLALAQNVTSLSAGTSRVYTQTSAPSSTGRQTGDIWYDTDNNFKPYVWYNNIWNDNTLGAFSQYAGLNATLTQMSKVVYDPSGANTSYEWIVKGQLGTNSTGAAAIRLTGAQKPNGSGGYTTTSKFIIDADTEINGSLVVAGTITGSRLATSASGATDLVSTNNIGNNAVSNSASSQGAGTATASITVRAGARVSVLATYAGNRNNGTGGGGNTLRVRANGADFANNTTSIFSVALVTAASSLAYISGNFVVTGLVTNYASTPATLLTIYNATSGGDITFTADSGGWNEVVSLLVMELAK